MTKQELEKAIENGESVWAVYGDCIVEETFFKNEERIVKNVVDFSKLHKTKAEAEHYLHHANITRTEQFPFLTWEEFSKGNKVYFNDYMYSRYMLCAKNNKILLFNVDCLSKQDNEWDLTEENFYKAYDECVRLFRGK